MPLRLILSFVLSAALSSLAHSQGKFSWLPVTAQEWGLAQDSSKKIRDAMMIFEKIVADETALDDEECHLRVYRRIKIFNAQGKSWADVNLPYDPRKQKIKAVGGRTILPNGTIIELAKDKVLEKQIVKTEEEELRQMFFSLPGVTDSCIVEYYCDYQNELNNPTWITQKDIYLLNAEYDWKFFNPSMTNLEALMLMIYSIGFAPNYLVMNTQQQPEIVMLPDGQKPDEAIFRMKDIPAYRTEPYCLPDEAGKGHIIFYYGSSVSPTDYWSVMAERVGAGVDKYVDDADAAKPLIGEFSKLPTVPEKCAAVQRWLQDHITNISYEETPGEHKENKSIDDVLERKYGTQRDINYVFYHVMKELNARVKIVYVARRDERLFYRIAKFWQFERPIIAVIDSSGGITYYSPGDAYTASRQVPWYYEGAGGFLVGAQAGELLFIDVPKSVPAINRLTDDIRFTLSGGDELLCAVHEMRSGHESRKIRLLLGKKDAGEQKNVVKKKLQEICSSDWKDSIAVSSIASAEDTLTLDYNLHGPALEPDPAGKIIFHPYSIFAEDRNPFVAETRDNPVMLENAVTHTMEITVVLGKGLSVDVLPPPVFFSNTAGEVILKTVQSGDTLHISSRYVLKAPFFSPNLYGQVKSLFQQRVGLKDVAFVLKKRK